MGKPIVSTSVGCEGVAALDGENILIRDDPLAFADVVIAVLEDHALARRLAERGRDTVERHYSWARIGQRMIDNYFTFMSTQSKNTIFPGDVETL